ncbi:MAG: reverse transcriptase domain-containing protein [Candidatus Thiodiazotropha sp.]
MSGHKGTQAKNNPEINNTVMKESKSTQAHPEPVSLIAPFHKNTILTTVGGRKTQALIDTGASISCVSKLFLTKTSYHNSELNPCELKEIVGVGGEKHSILGQKEIDILVSGVKISFPFYVLNSLHHSMILGMDFLEHHKVKIDIEAGTVYIKDKLLKSPIIRTKAGFARVDKPICVPAGAEVEMPVKVSKRKTDEVVLLEPIATLQNYGIGGAKCLVKVHKGKAVFRVLNPSDKNINIPANRIVASVCDVDSKHVHTLDGSQPDPTNSASVNKISVNDPSDCDNMTFNVSNENLSENEKVTLKDFLLHNRDIFSTSLADIGKTSLYQHRIETVPGAPPVRTQFYRQPPHLKAETDRQVNEMLQQGIIQQSTSLYNSPVVLVRKKDNTWRFAVDYRKLNKITVPISHPIPRLEDVFDAIGESQATFFSILDLNSAYFQIELDPETRHKSGFVTHDGVYEFLRMPFGLRNAPMSFQMLMSQVLKGLNWKFVLCYIDDILVFSPNFTEHLEHLGEVFQRLREAKLTLKPSKCSFAVDKVIYLGHVITKEGVSVDSDKTEKVNTFPPPKSQKELRGFLGLCNYYRRFVKDFSKICIPLNRLLKKEQRKRFATGDWNPECQEAFEKLKTALTTAPVLAYPDMNKPFVLSTDASGHALGYVLGQLDSSGKEHVIAYGGRALRPDERKWAVTELECLAVIVGIETFKHYLSQHKFKVFTDHKALQWLDNVKNPTGRLGRWAMKLQQHNFEIVHRQGTRNQNADFMSRYPYDQEPEMQDPASQLPVSSPEVQDTVSRLPVVTAEIQGPVSQLPEVTSEVQDPSNQLPVLTVEMQDLASQPPVSTAEMQHPASQHLVSAAVPGPAQACSDIDDVKPPACVSSVAEPDDEKLDLKEECTQKFYTEVTFEYTKPPMVAAAKVIPEPEPEMGDLQRKCDDFKDIFSYLQDRTLPEDEKYAKFIANEANQYVLRDGTLYHLFQPRTRRQMGDDLDRMILQLALPKVKRIEVLRAYHDCQAGGGHFGVTKTFGAIRLKYWWPRMYQMVHDYVQNCDVCQRIKVDRHRHPVPLNPLPVEEVFSRLHIDILGPLPKTKEGYQFCLVVVDSFSKWCESFALRTQEAKEAASILYNEVFTRYGAPRTIVSDRARNFMSKLVAALCEMFRVTRHYTSSYHPQTNATVERVNSTLSQTLRAYIDKDQSNWPSLLPSVMMAFRSTPCTESTQLTPFQLLFGREMNLPIDTTLIPKPSLGQNARQYFQELLNKLKTSQEIASENLRIAQEKAKLRHDVKAKIPTFNLQDLVLLKTTRVEEGLSKKLADKYTGPYYIVEIGPNHTYKLRNFEDNKPLSSLVNADRLKLYHDDPTAFPPVPDERPNPPAAPPDPPEMQPDPQAAPGNQPKPTSHRPSQATGQDQQGEEPAKRTKDGVLVPGDRIRGGEARPRNPSQKESDPNRYFEIEKLLRQKRVNGKRHFFVKWKDGSANSWQPEENISKPALRQYYATHTKKGKRRKRKPFKFFKQPQEAQQ